MMADMGVATGLDPNNLAWWTSYCGTIACRFTGVIPIAIDML